MNNYDYFSEIEGAFVRRRGRNLLLSPVDWALIESWEKQGVPLKIVLATIDDVFDQIEADPKRSGSVRTLSYCKDAVESRFRNWRESQVGASASLEPEWKAHEGSAQELAAPDEGLSSRLISLSEALEEAAAAVVRPGIKKAVEDAASELRELAARTETVSMDERLENLDESIDSALFGSLSETELTEALEAAETQLGSRRASMDARDLERTKELLVKKKLREASGIPPLGLYRL